MKELRGLARHAKESSPPRPRLTANVLAGIVAATGQVLAGPEDGECESDWANIERARAWAFAMQNHGVGARTKRIRKQQRDTTPGPVTVMVSRVPVCLFCRDSGEACLECNGEGVSE